MKRLSPLTVLALFILLTGFAAMTVGPRIYTGVQDFTGATVTGITGTTGPTGPTGPSGASGNGGSPTNTPANLWPMNEGTGNSFYDISSIVPNIVPAGGTIAWSAGPGTCFQCAHFDGSFSSTATNRTRFNPSGAFSVSFWVSWDALDSLDFVVTQILNSGNNPGWSIHKNDNSGFFANEMILQVRGGTSGAMVVAMSGAPSAAVVYNYMMTYSGSGAASGIKLYRNGVLQTTDTVIQDNSVGATTPGANVSLGSISTTSAGRHIGYLSGVATYNRELALADAQNNASGSPLTTPWVVPQIATSGTTTVASGAKTLSTSAITSATCTSAQTDSATGVVSTDAIIASFNGDPTAVTGYVPLTSGMLTIIPFPTSDTVNFRVCNNTSSSITPGAVTVNWRVVR